MTDVKINRKILYDFTGNKNTSKELLNFWKGVYNAEYSASEVKRKLRKFLPLNIEYNDIPVKVIMSSKLKKETTNWLKSKMSEFHPENEENYYGNSHKDRKKFKTVSGVGNLVKIIYSYFSVEGNRARKMLDYQEIQGVIPYFNRTEVIKLLYDTPSLFFENKELLKIKSYKATGLYLDVSGSMDDMIDSIYSLVLKLLPYVEPPHYIFSNRVFPVTIRDIKRMEFVTTGGTDLNSVIEHAKKMRFKNLIIITDGYFYIKWENREWAKRNLKILFVIVQNSDDMVYIDKDDLSNIKEIAERIIKWTP